MTRRGERGESLAVPSEPAPGEQRHHEDLQDHQPHQNVGDHARPAPGGRRGATEDQALGARGVDVRFGDWHGSDPRERAGPGADTGRRGGDFDGGGLDGVDVPPIGEGAGDVRRRHAMHPRPVAGHCRSLKQSRKKQPPGRSRTTRRVRSASGRPGGGTSPSAPARALSLRRGAVDARSSPVASRPSPAHISTCSPVPHPQSRTRPRLWPARPRPRARSGPELPRSFVQARLQAGDVTEPAVPGCRIPA